MPTGSRRSLYRGYGSRPPVLSNTYGETCTTIGLEGASPCPSAHAQLSPLLSPRPLSLSVLSPRKCANCASSAWTAGLRRLPYSVTELPVRRSKAPMCGPRLAASPPDHPSRLSNAVVHAPHRPQASDGQLTPAVTSLQVFSAREWWASSVCLSRAALHQTFLSTRFVPSPSCGSLGRALSGSLFRIWRGCGAEINDKAPARSSVSDLRLKSEVFCHGTDCKSREEDQPAHDHDGARQQDDEQRSVRRKRPQ